MVEIAYWDAQGIPHTADGAIYLGTIYATPTPGGGGSSVPGQDTSIDTSQVVGGVTGGSNVGTTSPSSAISAFGFGDLIDKIAGALKLPNWVVMAGAAVTAFYVLEKFGPKGARS